MSWISLTISVLYIILTCALAHIGRYVVNKFIQEPFVKVLFEEVIASAELCASCFELIIVADNYGVSAYALFLFLLTIWWSLNWGEATACPYNHLEAIFDGQTTWRKVTLITWAELIGGLTVFKYVQFLWNLEVAENHVGKAFQECNADLQVPMFYGALIEGIATCLCRLASRSIHDSDLRYATILDSFVSTFLVVAAFNYSGGYFNPVLATSLKFGCKGNTTIEHVVVYWIGACSGSIASVLLYKEQFIQKLLLTKTKVH